MSFTSRLFRVAIEGLAPQTPSRDPDIQSWHDDAQVLSAQFTETLNAASRIALMPLLVAGALATCFWGTAHQDEVVGLLIFVVTIASLSVVAPRFKMCRASSPQGMLAGLRLSVVIAAALGLCWGIMPIVLFAGADADHRLIIVAAVAVIMADVHRLGPMLPLRIAYLVPICVGCFIGFALGESATGFALALFVPFYGWCLLRDSARLTRVASRNLIDRISVVEQNQTIHELLLDFDEDTADWLWRTDAEGFFVDAAAGASIATIVPAVELEGIKFDALMSRLAVTRKSNGAAVVLAAFAARRSFRNQLVEIKGEPPQWWRLSGKPFYDEQGRFVGFRGIGCDMTGAYNSESRIAYLANFDALTGFANRNNFQTFSARQCVAAATDGQCRALLSLDLDGFKAVNDSLGHDGGDELLRQVAARLTATAPAGAFLARLGGDEFAIWLAPTTPAKAEDVARGISHAIGCSFECHGLKVDVGVSIGIVFTPKHGTDPYELLGKADLALYRAKAENKGSACVFVPSFEEEMTERRKLQSDLKLALARSQFVLHYQPLVDVTEGRVVGFEALIRWQSPERGLVSPGDFIPAAEAMGMIPALGRWVLAEACRAAATWPYDVHVSVNISPPHVRSREFLADVAMALKTSGLHPSRLEIEVTEGVFLDKSPAALEALGTLRMRGVRIALDDFGTGYSSLNYLVAFPVDKIKIDRSFISNLVDSPAHGAIVDAMLGLAKKLSIRVNAEGIETKDQALALKRRRCDELQGYLFSKPRPAADVLDMIETVPAKFREVVPSYMDSPLAMALAAKRVAAE